MTSIADCLRELPPWAARLNQARHVVVGIGEGFSAAAGLDEDSLELAQRWLPGFTELGLDSLRAIRAIIGPLKQNRPEVYWGFWGQYLLQVQYDLEVLAPYRQLARLAEERDCFFAAVTADGQLERAGIPENRRFTPLGDGRLFQCAQPCCDQLFPNEEQLRTMVEYLMTPREIDTRDVPACPRCGGPLIPNLKAAAGEAFVEGPHLAGYDDYTAFLSRCAGQPVLLLELGVGPEEAGAVIRRPLEQLALSNPQATLLRVGREVPPLPAALGERGLCLEMDPVVALDTLLKG